MADLKKPKVFIGDEVKYAEMVYTDTIREYANTLEVVVHDVTHGKYSLDQTVTLFIDGSLRFKGKVSDVDYTRASKDQNHANGQYQTVVTARGLGYEMIDNYQTEFKQFVEGKPIQAIISELGYSPKVTNGVDNFIKDEIIAVTGVNHHEFLNGIARILDRLLLPTTSGQVEIVKNGGSGSSPEIKDFDSMDVIKSVQSKGVSITQTPNFRLYDDKWTTYTAKVGKSPYLAYWGRFCGLHGSLKTEAENRLKQLQRLEAVYIFEIRNKLVYKANTKVNVPTLGGSYNIASVVTTVNESTYKQDVEVEKLI